MAQLPYFSAGGEVYTKRTPVEPESVIVFTCHTGNSAGPVAANKDFHLVVTW